MTENLSGSCGLLFDSLQGISENLIILKAYFKSWGLCKFNLQWVHVLFEFSPEHIFGFFQRKVYPL